MPTQTSYAENNILNIHVFFVFLQKELSYQLSKGIHKRSTNPSKLFSPRWIEQRLGPKKKDSELYEGHQSHCNLVQGSPRLYAQPQIFSICQGKIKINAVHDVMQVSLEHSVQ